MCGRVYPEMFCTAFPLFGFTLILLQFWKLKWLIIISNTEHQMFRWYLRRRAGGKSSGSSPSCKERMMINNPIFCEWKCEKFQQLFWSLQRYYMASSRELTMLDSITKAPIIHHFSETIAGIMTMHAFSRQEQFANVLLTTHTYLTLGFLFLCLQT